MDNCVNDDVFIVTIKVGIVKGKLLKKINDNEFEVLMECPTGKTKMQLHKKFLSFNKQDAEKKFCSLIHFLDKKKLSKSVEGNIDFLPEPIAELKHVYHSGNPLRFGEPKISSPIQSNVVTEYDNPQKIIQLIGAIWEDIEILNNILYVLSYANDYTKKLIGKYIIIELRSLSSSFERLSQLDNEYKDNLYCRFVDKVTQLDDKFKFGVIKTRKPVIRNKISAHRDSNLDLMTAVELWAEITRYNLTKYIEVFAEHINELLKKYPFETKMYFTMRRTPYHDITDVVNLQDNHYKPFDVKFGPKGG